MRRYQIYLNPDSVEILDEYEEYTKISRSKLIRQAIESVAENLRTIFVLTNTPPKKKNRLDRLAGFIKLPGKKKTNYATRHDSFYLKD